MLGFKKRSAPSRENWIEYANFQKGLPYRLFSDSNFFLFFMIFMTYFIHAFAFIVFLCCYYRFLYRFGREIDRHCDKDFNSQTMVYAIQRHHNQILKERLMEEPGLIDCVYKKKSLLYWSIHYKNIEAHRIIIQLIKERVLQRENNKGTAVL
ncbi:MAG: hypothetical protein H7177_06390 [Rhizobacter sp.]|nr:hypothetical protein [Bacteriovorax sp.]